jgi:hypothetical protein
MNTKLTLTIEQDIIKKAKIYANEKGRSLSDIIENYLKLIVFEEDQKDNENSPVVSSLLGSLKAPLEIDYKAELAKSLTNKYL